MQNVKIKKKWIMFVIIDFYGLFSGILFMVVTGLSRKIVLFILVYYSDDINKVFFATTFASPVTKFLKKMHWI